MILLAGGLVLVCGIFLAACFRLPNKPAHLLSIYLLGFSDIVLSGYIANTLGVLNQPWAWVTIHAVFAALSGLAWDRAGRPALPGPFASWRTDLESLRRLPIREHLPLVLLAAGMAAAYAIDLVLIVSVPQNNMDSLSTHLTRVGYWLQFGSFYPWPTSRALQLFYPVNAQLQVLWTAVFLHSDVFAGTIQWIAALSSAAGVFAIARATGFSRVASAYAALIFLGFPMVLLQSTTAQNDLVTAALFVPAVYFLILGMEGGTRSMLALSALSIGLGLGTKQTYYFLLPGLGLFAIGALIRLGRLALGRLVFWGAACVLAFGLFAVYMNVVNWQYFGHPFGPAEFFEAQAGTADPATIAGDITYNIPRMLYQAVDTSGLPRPFGGYAHKVKMLVGGALLQSAGLNIEGGQFTASNHVFSLAEENTNEESLAWFGPLSVLLLFPMICYALCTGVRDRDYVRIGLGANAAVFLVIDVILRPGWDPYQGRYFAPVVAAASPLIAAWPWERRAPLFRWSAVLLALVVTYTTVLFNPAKPIAGKFADSIGIWSNDRVYLQTVERKKDRDVNYLVAQNVPADAVLGLYLKDYVLDYPFFGERFQRRLIPVYPYDRITDVAWFRANHIQYLLVQGNDAIYDNLAEVFVRVGKIPGWRLYRFDSD